MDKAINNICVFVIHYQKMSQLWKKTCTRMRDGNEVCDCRRKQSDAIFATHASASSRGMRAWIMTGWAFAPHCL
jgi:hypothetical protein